MTVEEPSVEELPVGVADAITRELARWLEGPEPDAAAARLRAWDARTWAGLRRAIAMHGLAPHIIRSIPQATTERLLPPDVRAWLIEQDARNEQRLRRLHDELAAILGAAFGAGIEVMPLKGALLTGRGDADPYRRPMSDLDLLVRPVDAAAAAAILVELGYRRVAERSRRPTHDVFVGPDGGRRVSADGEHPDNPRRVELHTGVKRHLWGWTDQEDDALTAALWASTTRADVVGRPATIPRPVAFAAHLALHASSDLLAGRGRLVQWLDLASVSDSLEPELGSLPHAQQAFPAIALAARAQPRNLALDLGTLRASVPARLVRWAATVPLDHRAGLTTGRSPDHPDGWAERWQRWRPDPWRLSAAYGDGVLPMLVGRHAVTVARRLRRG